MSSTQRGNISKHRAQKHKNSSAFKNDKYDTTGKMKAINSLVVSNVCQRCKDCIEWKIKYKKYKSLTVPGKCVKCGDRKVKYSYHIVCSECAIDRKICAKCTQEKEVVGEVEKSPSEKQREENYLREQLKHMRLREKRTLLRQLDRGTITEIPTSNDDGSDADEFTDEEDDDDVNNGDINNKSCDNDDNDNIVDGNSKPHITLSATGTENKETN